MKNLAMAFSSTLSESPLLNGASSSQPAQIPVLYNSTHTADEAPKEKKVHRKPANTSGFLLEVHSSIYQLDQLTELNVSRFNQDLQ